MKILSIDPGTEQSAYVIWDGKKIDQAQIVENAWLLDSIQFLIEDFKAGTFLIEQVKCYGMIVGESVLETVFWSGRFWQVAELRGVKCARLPRMAVKMHLCHSSRAKDSNVIQALIDRFALGQPNRGKGTKKRPGFFYGFHDDIWQAFALSVAWNDLQGHSGPGHQIKVQPGQDLKAREA